jgi:Aminotransferase class-V
VWYRDDDSVLGRCENISILEHDLEGKSTGSLKLGALMDSVDAVRAQFSRLVNATPDEIGLLFSTGDGENVIANGVGLRAGDNVVVDDLHYTTEFVLYRALEASRGIELRIVKNWDGAVTASDFEPHIDKRTRIVSVAWVSNQNGFRHDMRPLADLAHVPGTLALYAFGSSEWRTHLLNSVLVNTLDKTAPESSDLCLTRGATPVRRFLIFLFC